MIDYSSPAAIGELGQQVSNNTNFLRSQDLGMQEAQLNSQLQTAAAQRDEMQQQMQLQQQRMAQEQVQQQPSPAQGGMAGAVRIPGPDGNSYLGTPQQAIQMRNLANAGISDPDQLAAATKQIMGVPNTVPVKLPDGSTAYLPPEQAGLMGIRGAQLGLAGQRVNQGQERVAQGQERVDQNADKIRGTQEYRDARLKVEQSQLDAARDRIKDSGFWKQIDSERKSADEVVAGAQSNVSNAARALTESRRRVEEAEIESKGNEASKGVIDAKRDWATAQAKADAAAEALPLAQQARVQMQEQHKQAVAQRLSGGTSPAAAQPQGLSPVGSAAPQPSPDGGASAPQATFAKAVHDGTVINRGIVSQVVSTLPTNLSKDDARKMLVAKLKAMGFTHQPDGTPLE